MNLIYSLSSFGGDKVQRIKVRIRNFLDQNYVTVRLFCVVVIVSLMIYGYYRSMGATVIRVIF